MRISYDLFTGAFLSKVTEYDFLKLPQFERDQEIIGYMKRACAQFNHMCKYDLTDRDDIVREFNVEIPENEIDEIIEIVTEGMVVQWMKPHVNHVDAMSLMLNTTDFYMHSPAEMLYRLTNAYTTAQKNFVRLMREYTYNHGDLTDLHL